MDIELNIKTVEEIFESKGLRNRWKYTSEWCYFVWAKTIISEHPERYKNGKGHICCNGVNDKNEDVSVCLCGLEEKGRGYWELTSGDFFDDENACKKCLNVYRKYINSKNKPIEGDCASVSKTVEQKENCLAIGI